LQSRIDGAVFPALQGGPHNATIGALAVQLKEVAMPSFRDYCGRVVANCRALAAHLTAHGCTVVTGGTDNHLLLLDLRPAGLTGSKMERVCERASLVVNRNALPGDTSPSSPGGIRIGSCGMTTRGATEQDFELIGAFLLRAQEIALAVQGKTGKRLADFTVGLEDAEAAANIAALRSDVEAWAVGLPYPT
jgi:glycine hydroxymethyltransferase